MRKNAPRYSVGTSLCTPGARVAATLAAALVLALAGATSHAADEPYAIDFPLGIDGEQMIVPEDNPITAAKVELGKLLYFDGRLSQDGTVSCATCHDPGKGFTDQLPTSKGIRGQVGARNAPSVINSAFYFFQFWDGRAPTLEEQAKGPIINPIEMGSTHELAVETIAKIPGYEPYFEKAFGSPAVDIDPTAVR